MEKCSKGETQINNCLYFTISKLFRVVNKVAEESFGRMDICPTHAFLMVLLEEEKDGLSVNKISEALTIAPSTVTRFVDKLVLKGYVERTKSGKQSFTKITETGLEAMPEIYKSWEIMFGKIERMAGDKKYLGEMLKQIRDLTDILEENQKYL